MIRMKNSLLIVGTACVALGLGSCSKSSSTTDSEEGNWVKRGQFDGDARTAAVSFVINNVPYVGTGFNSAVTTDRANVVVNRTYKDFWKLNLSSDVNGNSYWTQVAEFPGTYRSGAVGFNIGNKGYVGMGLASDRLTYLNDFYEFNGSAWTKRPDVPLSGRVEAVGFGIKNKGYITTGFGDGTTQKDIAAYDTTTKTWSTGNIPTLGGDKRRGAIVMLHNDVAYVLGGTSSSATSLDMFAFDGTSWSQKASLFNEKDDSFDDEYGSSTSSNIARSYGVGLVIGNYGYVTTGQGQNGGFNNQTWRYDFATDRWVVRTSYERAGRIRAVGFTVNNRAFIGLGENGATALENFDEFRPDETYNSND